MELIAKADLKIQRPVADVFESIVDPRKLEGYLVRTASGRIESGATLRWEWEPQYGGGAVHVERVEVNKLIRFRWPVEERENTVIITLEKSGENGTKVSIEEDGWPKDDKGIKGYAGNTRGWTNFLDCLKAYVEHGINLRKGAF